MRKLGIILIVFLIIIFGTAAAIVKGQKLECESPNMPINTRQGQDFVIKLKSNPTTGYGWKLAGGADKNIVRFIDSRYRPSLPKTIGSGGFEYWRFKAVGKGRAILRFHYIRPWEEGASPAETKVFTVNVIKNKIN